MKRKSLLMAGVIVFMLAASTGCGGQNMGREQPDGISAEAVSDEKNADRKNADTENVDAEKADTENVDAGNPDAEKADTENTNAQNADKEESSQKQEEEKDEKAAEIIGGKVRNIGQDSFVISRTLIDENGYVTMPEAGSPDEQLVTVQCTDTTVFEHWTIQGGGAGIEKKEAAFSDIIDGGGLEAEGYFEGAEFVAEKVIIEVYQ